MEAARQIVKQDYSHYIADELKKFNFDEAAIAAKAKEYMALKVVDIKDSAGLRMVHDARIVIKNTRVGVEKTRKELKEDSIHFGRSVDNEAKRLTAILEPIEKYLETEENRIEDEKERIRQAELQKKREITNTRIKALTNHGHNVVDVFAVADMSEPEFDKMLTKVVEDFEAEKKRQMEKAKETDRRMALMGQYCSMDSSLVSQMEPEAFQSILAEAKKKYDEAQTLKAEAEKKAKAAKEEEEKRQEAEKQRLAKIAAEQAVERERLAKIAADQAAQQSAEKERLAKIEEEQKVKALEIKKKEDDLLAEKAKLEAERLRVDKEALEKAEAAMLDTKAGFQTLPHISLVPQLPQGLKSLNDKEAEDPFYADNLQLVAYANAIGFIQHPVLVQKESQQRFKIAFELITEATSLLRGAPLCL